ncbi:hypothetical protein Droror1_Dr00022267 [Drosera rotundifolia]
MPSLWRKSSSSLSKGNRISRFVADVQTPPKQGSSLVVETRFPTSLVDLFVKNRDRIKKQKKKCVSNPQSIDSDSAPASLALSSCDSWSIRLLHIQMVMSEYMSFKILLLGHIVVLFVADV